MPSGGEIKTVYINRGFIESKEEIKEVFRTADTVELRAKDRFIQLAIQLSEYFLSDGWAAYQKFNSSLTTNQEGQKIPQISIILNYIPQQTTGQKKQYKEKQSENYSSKNENDRGNNKSKYQQKSFDERRERGRQQR